MSTLKTANIQDTSGSNNSTPEQISQGRAKAWVNFDGTAGAVSINNSFNVSAVTENATGAYTVTFTNAMPNANYCPVVSNQYDNTQTVTTGGAGIEVGIARAAFTTTQVHFHCFAYTGALYACKTLAVAIFGD